MDKPKLLWVGDAGCPSGFAKATHYILDTLQLTFDVTVLGINYNGDPHGFSYPMYAAAFGGDFFGEGRLIYMCDLVHPDVIILQNDPWNIPKYVKMLTTSRKDYEEPIYKDIPIVTALAVDGKNLAGNFLKGISHAIFWTQFALDEARAGGYVGPATVIPLGVDRRMFFPRDKDLCRLNRMPQLLDRFIVGNVNRQQFRKRWDLTLRYFAMWMERSKAEDAVLYLHASPSGDQAVNLRQLAAYYELKNVILVEPPDWYGMQEEHVAETYNCFDVQISTTQGEGFGLTTFEGMACGIPQIVPDWSALGEIAKDAAMLVPCTSTVIGPPFVNVIGGVADEEGFIRALDAVYREKDLREKLRVKGLERAAEDRYRWSNIGSAYDKILQGVVERKQDAVEVGV